MLVDPLADLYSQSLLLQQEDNSLSESDPPARRKQFHGESPCHSSPKPFGRHRLLEPIGLRKDEISGVEVPAHRWLWQVDKRDTALSEVVGKRSSPRQSRRHIPSALGDQLQRKRQADLTPSKYFSSAVNGQYLHIEIRWTSGRKSDATRAIEQNSRIWP